MDMLLTVNENSCQVRREVSVPLLWVLREDLALTGTKFGCGMGLCGACTVHVDGAPTRSCITPADAVVGKRIVTIEGARGAAARAIQQAWEDLNVVQCGYCQPGQVMSAVALLEATDDPTDEQIDAAMAGNLCRCGTYPRIRGAIRLAAKRLRA